MNEEEREALKQAILDQIENLEKAIPVLEEGTAPIAPDRAIGRLTRMEAINAQKMTEANLRKAQTQLAALKRTLPLIDEDDEYGICARCERPIPLKRLMLVPQSRLCVPCADRR